MYYLQQKYFFAHYSCTRNAIHNHLADRTQFRLMACNLTVTITSVRFVALVCMKMSSFLLVKFRRGIACLISGRRAA